MLVWSAEEDTTRLQPQANMHNTAFTRLATPILRRIAPKEHTAIVDALSASFGTSA